MPEISINYHPGKAFLVAFWGALFILSTLFMGYLSTLVYDSDLAILSGFAARMLEGHKFSEMYYETNPPLSIIIYAPVVLLQSISGWPVYLVNLGYTLFWVLASFAASAVLLQHIKGIETGYARHLLLAGFILTQIGIPSHEFGDRDHLAVLGLIPFTLLQILILQDQKPQFWTKYGVLIFGTIAILIKPHYGLVPALMIAYRFFRKDGFAVIKGADFIALASGVMVYAAIVIIVFNDYVSVVLADSITLYASQRNPELWKDVLVYGILLIVMMAMVDILKFDKSAARLVYMTGIITAALFIPYIVQGKGLVYHRIPFWSFWHITLMLCLFFGLRRIIQPKAAFLIAVVACITLIALTRMPVSGVLTHDDFRRLPLSNVLEENCPAPCSFLLLDDNASNMHRLAAYHEAFHASRFTSMWFLPELIKFEDPNTMMGRSSLDEQDYARLKAKYSIMVGEDLKRMKPAVIIVLETMEAYPDFDMIGFFKNDPVFASEFETHYIFDRKISFDRKIYFPEMTQDRNLPATYSIYLRQ